MRARSVRCVVVVSAALMVAVGCSDGGDRWSAFTDPPEEWSATVSEGAATCVERTSGTVRMLHRRDYGAAEERHAAEREFQVLLRAGWAESPEGKIALDVYELLRRYATGNNLDEGWRVVTGRITDGCRAVWAS